MTLAAAHNNSKIAHYAHVSAGREVDFVVKQLCGHEPPERCDRKVEEK
jgi:hypothetical protein